MDEAESSTIGLGVSSASMASVVPLLIIRAATLRPPLTSLLLLCSGKCQSSISTPPPSLSLSLSLFLSFSVSFGSIARFNGCADPYFHINSSSINFNSPAGHYRPQLNPQNSHCEFPMSGNLDWFDGDVSSLLKDSIKTTAIKSNLNRLTTRLLWNYSNQYNPNFTLQIIFRLPEKKQQLTEIEVAVMARFIHILITIKWHFKQI